MKILQGISEEIRKFYYVENPYFGKCIAKRKSMQFMKRKI